MVEAACCAHARRKLHYLHEAHRSPTAAEALQRIAALSASEAEIRGKPLDERQREREARSRPLLNSLHQWLREQRQLLSRQSDKAGAITDALTRWDALVRCCSDDTLEIDNNAAGRAAALYSLLGTAKLNGLDPEAYLRHLLERIGEHPINHINELWPWRVADRLTGTYSSSVSTSSLVDT